MKKNVNFKLKSFNKQLLNFYILYLKKAFKILNIQNYSINYLPLKIKKLTLLKSPHVHKKFYEHFNLKKYSLFIQFKFKKKNLNLNKIISKFFIINKPSGIKLIYKKF